MTSTPTDEQAVWLGDRPEPGELVLVVAPHPDDEVIGAAGLMVWLAALRVRTELVAVTDGEASHARSTRVTPEELRVIRAEERTVALATLGLTVDTERLAVPDGAVARHEERLRQHLEERADHATTIVAPWRRDGHPDHEAVWRAADAAARRTGARLWEVPIWAKTRPWRWLGRPEGIHQGSLQLSPVVQDAKQTAVRCHGSQLVALGPDPEDGPVVHPDELQSMLDGREQVRWS